MNELRRDYFTDRWVIIATDRAKRPTDFVKPRPAEGGPVDMLFLPGQREQ